MAQNRTGKLGEEALNEIEPGTVRRCEGELEPASGSSDEPRSGFSRDVRGMIVENQLDGGASRIGGIKKLEEFDELSAAVAIPDQGMNLPGEQINPGQQAECAMAFILMITREGRVDAGFGRQIGRGRCDGLDTWFFVVGDDRHWLTRVLRLGSLFQELDLAINAQNLRHLLLELGVTTFQIVPHLVRLNFLLTKNLAYGALDQIGKTFVPRGRRILACMAGQQPCCPQLVRITVLLGLLARQRHQPSLGLRRNRRLLAWSRPVVECRQWAIGQRPFEAALDSLMMSAKSLPHGIERGALAVGKQHSRPLHPTHWLASRARNGCQPANFFLGHRQLDRLSPLCHDATPRSIRYKRGIHERVTGSMSASFMESVV